VWHAMNVSRLLDSGESLSASLSLVQHCSVVHSRNIPKYCNVSTQSGITVWQGDQRDDSKRQPPCHWSGWHWLLVAQESREDWLPSLHNIGLRHHLRDQPQPAIHFPQGRCRPFQVGGR